MRLEKVVEETGYSLVESIVALALLATVLAPLSHFIVSFATQRMSKQKIEAFMAAQAVMEDALINQHYGEKPVSIRYEKWLITKENKVQEGLVIIEVKVANLSRRNLQIVLRTARLLPTAAGNNQP